MTKNGARLGGLIPTMRRNDFIDPRSILTQVPQTLPVSQLELEALPNENELTPDKRDAKVEIFLITFWL
ncbi:MAG TPA: hypothetical protein VLD65_10045 [Anaerolineales bacterium]|nr:hypothetical protein [Anaerolineales bacterium]